MGENCNCKLKCFVNIGPEGCKAIYTNFYGISSKDLQDAYLYGLIKRDSVNRQRPRSGEGQAKSSTYLYREIRICKKAFLSVHGLSKSRLERLQKHLSHGNSTPPTDRRGRHEKRPNKLHEDINTKIREHILSFPRYKSHYSRKDNIHHESVAFPVFYTFGIKNKKILETITFPNNDQKLYEARRLLKKTKCDHVMILAKNYVPKCDLWYYNEIEEYHKSYQLQDHETSVSEFSSDE
ncbi:hypothetical protein RN001_005790 [Aquatica leii]|uniref:Uncharacterized protein n=1 Tax=Aquatica leii TaxID=1421715 RepID=A0AAN7PKC7_9COLE|nr:hypothetical protein RN001_005790 [Aquatica leii]